jgi:hypothetical protein
MLRLRTIDMSQVWSRPPQAEEGILGGFFSGSSAMRQAHGESEGLTAVAVIDRFERLHVPAGDKKSEFVVARACGARSVHLGQRIASVEVL